MSPFEIYLLRILNNTQVLPDGSVYEIKQLMGRINGVKIEMYSNDHNPPHFHVKTNCGRINATFKLDDCSLLTGDISRDDLKRVKYFFDTNKEKLQSFWNEKTSKK